MLDLESEVQGSILTWGNILLLEFFCFPCSKAMMLILALLPISGVSKNLYHSLKERFSNSNGRFEIKAKP